MFTAYHPKNDNQLVSSSSPEDSLLVDHKLTFGGYVGHWSAAGAGHLLSVAGSPQYN